MKAIALFAQRFVIGALLLALLAASAGLALLALAFLYRPTTLDAWLAAWHILLNGGNCALLLVVLIAGGISVHRAQDGPVCRKPLAGKHRNYAIGGKPDFNHRSICSGGF